MSQSEVLELLKRQPDIWFHVKEVSRALDIGETSSTENLKRLRRRGFIEFKIVERGKYLYKYKITD